jgi:hypothetical protein
MLLRQLDQLEEPRLRRVGQNGDTEVEHVASWSRAGKHAFSLEISGVAIWSYVVFALLAGAMLPTQFGINSQLAEWVGGSVRAAIISFMNIRSRR